MSTSDAAPDAPKESMDYSTDFEMGQDNIRPFGLDIHNPVFLISSVLIMGFVLLALANQEASANSSAGCGPG
jgi:BCCT family betaine/carnitine transporter